MENFFTQGATGAELGEAAGRMLAACAFGFVIGFEREFRRRPAGLRTHMLTALAACAFMIVALEMVDKLADTNGIVQLDPIRTVEAVTAGVAFLAAGTIIQSRSRAYGLTTGAGMWLAGAAGLAAGAGYVALGALATLFGFLILSPLRLLEKRFKPAQGPEDDR